MNIEDTTRLVLFTQALWPSWSPATGTADAWHSVLWDTDYQIAKRVLAEWSSQTWPPPVGRIRDAVALVRGGFATFGTVPSGLSGIGGPATVASLLQDRTFDFHMVRLRCSRDEAKEIGA